MGAWTSGGPRSPQRLLNAYVCVHTTFIPIDCNHVLLADEPEVPLPKLRGFMCEKHKQGTAFLHVTASYAIDGYHYQDPRLLEELATSLYTYIIQGQYPMWYNGHDELVEYGIARFIKGGDVNVAEPMALVGILHFFAQKGPTMNADIRRRMQGSKGLAFEEAVLLSLTRLFRDGKPLSDVFKFVGKESDPEKNVPDWAHQKGYTVSQTSEKELVVVDIVNENSVIPSAGVTCFAKHPDDVRDWITSKRSM